MGPQRRHQPDLHPHRANQLTVYCDKCLDTSNGATSAGTAVVIGDCDNTASQQWSLNANGTITNTPSGLCMDATGRGTSNGTKIIIWTGNGRSNQRWTLH